MQNVGVLDARCLCLVTIPGSYEFRHLNHNRVDNEDGSTRYGFRWGPVKVERVAAIKRGAGTYRVLRLATVSGQVLDIYISPEGRRVRVFRKNKEMK